MGTEGEKKGDFIKKKSNECTGLGYRSFRDSNQKKRRCYDWCRVKSLKGGKFTK